MKTGETLLAATTFQTRQDISRVVSCIVFLKLHFGVCQSKKLLNDIFNRHRALQGSEIAFLRQ